MGRHKQIETILLRELTIGEDRAERALSVIHHQQTAISQLQKTLKEQLSLHEQIQKESDGIEVEDYLKIQAKVESLQNHLREIQEIQMQLSKPETNLIAAVIVPKAEACVQTHEEIKPTLVDSSTEPLDDAEGSNLVAAVIAPKAEACVQTYEEIKPTLVDSSTEPLGVAEEQGKGQEFNFDAIKELHPKLEALALDLEYTKESVDKSSLKEINFKRKLNSLRRKVKWLKQERDEVIGFLDQLAEWQRHVEGILLDLSAGIKEDVDVGRVESGDVGSNHTRQIWETARKFFTSDESKYLLCHEKN